MATLVIAKYHCEVAGKVAGDVDYRVRYFETDDEDEIVQRLRVEEPTSYKNSSGEIVSWVFDGTEIFAHDPKYTDGAEIIGFITGEPKDVTEPISGANAG
jgi:hypothetical protein